MTKKQTTPGPSAGGDDWSDLRAAAFEIGMIPIQLGGLLFGSYFLVIGGLIVLSAFTGCQP